MPSTKPFKVVLRGLVPFSTDEVKPELLNNGLTPLNVYPMTRRSIENITFRNQLFLVHFTKGTTNISALKNIKDLFRMIVSWEPYRPQHRDVTLCTNCQRFGHVDDSVLKCVNCGGDHGTSNRACPKRAEFISIRLKATTSNQPGRKRNVRTPPINSEAEFPALQHRRQVTDLAPLPLNNQRSSNFTPANSSNLTDTLRRSAQPRLAAAAAQPMQRYSPAPTLSYADVASGISSDMFTSQELLTLVSEVIIIMRTCKTQTEQLQAVLSLIKKYVP
ncbi:uncharacterized protein LOC129774159 [Toxorhynchites rutilus septentrionalis]|uniref:uncharacterized protein LOC129774159 n=1 Tax=Toxorhynchites rutilus septentrionalis TaxID=329112 RepID=UPI002478DF8B|nr:uncharacterized protein LOC129774159 [Toxorhynchites rutilus septentrionalis]